MQQRKKVDKGRTNAGKLQAELLYTDNRMVYYTNSVWFQTAFDTLTGLFNWVGLKTNL